MGRKLKELLIIPLMTVFAIVGLDVISNSAYAEQDACNPNNPNYCQECRDESKRDFARCGEVDYANIELLKHGQVIQGHEGMAYPDYDSVNKKIVFTVALSKENAHFEIFTADDKGENQKRVTWNSTKHIGSLNPFWTKDRRIGYLESDTSYNPARIKYFLINEDGTGKEQIGKSAQDQKKVRKLYNETHKNKECLPIVSKITEQAY